MSKLAPISSLSRNAGLVALALCLALPAAASAQRSIAGSARSELLRLRDRIENELRNSPEMQRAVLDARDARREYVAARSVVYAKLELDSDYRAARVEADALQEQLDEVYFTYRYGVAPTEQTHTLAKQILAIRREAAAKRADALIQHVATQETRERFLAAGRRLASLRRAIPDAIRNDARFRRFLQSR